MQVAELRELLAENETDAVARYAPELLAIAEAADVLCNGPYGTHQPEHDELWHARRERLSFALAALEAK